MPDGENYDVLVRQTVQRDVTTHPKLNDKLAVLRIGLAWPSPLSELFQGA